ncbi:glycoside hydrolase family 43 protein [Ramaria rubella]|nr:glycoside hydrolase family 43 protein [Ramaria rubella]
MGAFFTTLTCVLAASLAAASDQLTSYNNPVIPGFHPDPSCIHVPEWDNTFFCATSSFNAFPGIPVFESKDLINFKQIGNVLNRPSQLPGLAHTNGSTSGMWAPSLRFHEGTFWVVTTLVYDHLPQDDAARWDNMIYKTTNPYSNSWSDPVHFTFEGYDTSPFWASNGDTYVQGSHAWQVRPVIQGFIIDLDTGAMGTIMDLWNGTGGLAPEAPHLFLKDDFYYLMIAEGGGTGLNHMVTMARSRDIFGPFESNPANPVLTNANTSQYCEYHFALTVGHADLFTDTNGNWWAVALSTRSGPDFVYYPMGRETVLTPVTWKTGNWPTFTPVRGEENGPLPVENKNIVGEGTWEGTSESLTFSPGSSLPNHFVYNRFPDPNAYTISPPNHPHTLRLSPSVLNLTGLDGRSAATPQTFVGRRQEHVQFTLEATLDFDPKQDEEEAGLTVFLNQAQHFDLGIVALSPQAAVQAGYKGTPNSTGLSQYIRMRDISANSTNAGADDTISRPGIAPLQENVSKVRLQVEAVNNTWYAFRYNAESEWTTVGWGVSSEVSGGFTGTILGMFATGNGEEGSDPAYFSDFSYIGNTTVF